MNHNYAISTLEELEELSSKILDLSHPIRIFTLTGDLGSGKTTLVQNLVRKLGSQDRVKSPTFSLVNEYRNVEESIYHFDLYRIKNMDELQDIGIFEYLDSGNFCFIEWPEIIEEYLDMPFCAIKMSIEENKSRNVTLALYKNIS